MSTTKDPLQAAVDLMLADPSVSYELRSAVAKLMPPVVTRERLGSGGLITVTGVERDVVDAKLQDEAKPYPAIAYGTIVTAANPQLVDGKSRWVGTVRWYSAD